MRILVVEDEQKVAGFIERGLKEERYTVDVAYDGEDGLLRALTVPYDLVVLDVNLPKMDGFTVLKRIRAAGSNSKVMMLTARDAIRDRVAGLDSGADDYLVKPFAFEEFLARVRALLRRESVVTPILRVADLELDPMSQKVTRGGKSIQLTAKEYSVLICLMQQPGKVITRTRLFETVWELDFDPASNVVDVTMYHLREKVDRGFGQHLIHTVRGAGYVINAEGQA